MTRLLARTVAVGALTLAPALASAQEVSGTIGGTLGLDEVTWYVSGTDAEQASYWRRTDRGLEVQLVGHPSREQAADMEDAIVVRFRAVGGSEEREARDVTVRYTPGDGPEQIGTGENMRLSLQGLDVAGSDLSVAGTFAGRLNAGGAEERILSDSDTLTVDADFQATVTRRRGAGS